MKQKSKVMQGLHRAVHRGEKSESAGKERDGVGKGEGLGEKMGRVFVLGKGRGGKGDEPCKVERSRCVAKWLEVMQPQGARRKKGVNLGDGAMRRDGGTLLILQDAW